jgi:hypothetical protein
MTNIAPPAAGPALISESYGRHAAEAARECRLWHGLRPLCVDRCGRRVHTSAAVKVLPDGRNAHLIQRPASWWLPKLMERFELAAFNRMHHGFWVAVEPQLEDGRAAGRS